MNNQIDATDTTARPVGCDALLALASQWEAESKRFIAESKQRWHGSDNLDLEHQAQVFRRCFAELRKLMRANDHR